MFPRGLTREYQKRVIKQEHAREQDKQTDECEESQPDTRYVVPVIQVLRVRVTPIIATQSLYDSELTAFNGTYYGKTLEEVQGLEEKEQIEFPVVQFTYTATDPEAMVVKFSHTTLTFTTML